MGSGVGKGAVNGCTGVGHGGAIDMDVGGGMGGGVGVGGGDSMSRGVDMMMADIGAFAGMEDEKCGMGLRGPSR